MQVCAWMVYPLLFSGTWYLESYIHPWITPAHRETCAAMNNQENVPEQKLRNTPTRKISGWPAYVTSNANRSHFGALLYFYENNKAVMKMILKAEVRQWDMCPVPTELRQTGCSTELCWTHKSKSNMLTLKTNSQTHWHREILHVMNGIISCVCSISAFSAVPAAAKRCHKNATRNRRRKNCGKVDVDADAEPGFEDCGKLFNIAEFECIKTSGDTTVRISQHKVQGNLPLEVMNGTTFSVCSMSWTSQSFHPAISAQSALLRKCRKGCSCYLQGIVSWTVLMNNQSCSIGTNSHNTLHCSYFKTSETRWRKIFGLTKSKIESSSCRCRTTSLGDQEETKKFV